MKEKGANLNHGAAAPKKATTELIHNQLKNHHVLLVLKDRTSDGTPLSLNLEEIREEFWNPLKLDVNRQKTDGWLLLLIVDSQGKYAGFAEQSPVRVLPQVSRYQEDHFFNWYLGDRRTLPGKAGKFPAESFWLKSDNGVVDKLLVTIGDACNVKIERILEN
jgi:hypothetical protein